MYLVVINLSNEFCYTYTRELLSSHRKVLNRGSCFKNKHCCLLASIPYTICIFPSFPCEMEPFRYLLEAQPTKSSQAVPLLGAVKMAVTVVEVPPAGKVTTWSPEFGTSPPVVKIVCPS